MRNSLQEHAEIVYNLRHEGKTLGEIADIVGISKQAASMLLRKEEQRRDHMLYFTSSNRFRGKTNNYTFVVYPNIANWMKEHNISFYGMYQFGGLTTKREKTRIRSLLTGKYKFWRAKEIDFMCRITGMSPSEVLYRPEE